MHKYLYLARHGLTLGNIANTLQDNSDPLSDQGRAQAARLAERFATLAPDTLIASDAARAFDTATIIGTRIDRAVVTSTLLRETSVPSSLVGVRRDDERALAWYADSYPVDNLHARVEDEETFAELTERASAAVAFTLEQPGNVAVVSHGNFIRFMVAHILMGEMLTPLEWKRFCSFFGTTNTGLTVLRYTEGKWLLVTWNDHAHLAD
jgi:broad specificity phosphatase PhoE